MRKLLLALTVVASLGLMSFTSPMEQAEGETSLEVFYEFQTIVDQNGLETCQARACFQTSETTRTCTEWIDVPCNGKGTLEIKKIA
ncbi:hypothetical protein [uncultured Nonlabens sp.]|uniref:hypothetical protein n=1 Tax=uncultured Nonlabens sp. TaxID=859306 RepID=UPI002632340B|nr:hypothetical protein [uncultured Nonlabens sp.]